MRNFFLIIIFLVGGGLGGSKADNRSQQLLLTMQSILMAGTEEQAFNAFFLEEAEADSIASYYMDLLPEGSQTDSAKKYIKLLFLNRTHKAADFLRSHYFGDLRYIQEIFSENQKKLRLHFYRIKAAFVSGTKSELLEIGAVLINGRLKIIHAEPWKEE
ncbi:MAG: hypothetical protein RML72_06620 [Bacteroidia bacterium]|nr:hypothetical protein [Bacteroidia bacterium]MDW8158532.1 hypothetical protein [Bacteroidia bacterium]